MDYLKIYKNLIANAKCREIEHGEYYEVHHIVPRCMGGDNSEENLVALKAREHFISHRLLCKIYPDNVKLKIAVLLMSSISSMTQEYKVNSRTFARVKKEMSDIRKSSLTGVDLYIFNEKIRVPTELSNITRGMKCFSKIKPEKRICVNIFILNMIAAKLADKPLYYPRSKNARFFRKNLSARELMKIQDICSEQGWVSEVVNTSHLPLSKRGKSYCTPSDKLIVQFESAIGAIKVNLTVDED